MRETLFTIDLSGKTAWVTGGSRGIGRATVLALAKAGCDVAIGFNSKEEQAAAVAKEVLPLGRKAIAIQMNVANEESCVEAHKRIAAELGPIDILVNNAGVVADNLFIMLEGADWKKVMDTNVMGVVHVTKTVIRDMMMKRTGRIVNISSVAGTKGGRGQANYAASKGAVEALTRSLAVELGARNITVNCVAPGVIETEMSAEVIKLAKDEILARQVSKRFGKAEEIAAWVVFVASSYGDYMTGQTIHVDGGMKMP